MSGMFERYTERARQVVMLAQQEARSLHHHRISTAHILLGLLREEEGVACQVLESLDVTVERVHPVVIRVVGVGETVVSGDIPFTPRAKKVLGLEAPSESLNLGHNHIGTEHILLGLVRENDGVAVRILLNFDADAEKIRAEVICRLAGPAGGSKSLATSPPAIGHRIDALEIQISRLFGGPTPDGEAIRMALQHLHDCRDRLDKAGLL